MALIPINNAGQYGVLTDRLPHELPPNAWSSGKNIRTKSGTIEKFLGHEQAFTTPLVAPYFLMPVTGGQNYYWMVAGLSKVYAWDGGSYINITRQSGGIDVDYNAAALTNWTGATLGNLAILNNGINLPQSWVPSSSRMEDLANWSPLNQAGTMRAFRRHLVALDVTKDGTRYPQMVKWSHPASAGNVPESWEETDETRDAGEYEILDSNGAAVDGVRLRDNFVIYKEDSVHWMQYIGGTDIFRFAPMFDSFGILSRRCAVEYAKGRHAVFAIGDVITHDGQFWESIVDHRMRRWLFNQIDQTNYATSFVGWNPTFSEVWFCFPVVGSGIPTPTQALVWNYAENTLAIRDLPGTAHIATGAVALSQSSDIWDSDLQTWDSDTTVWSQGVVNPTGRRTLMADPANAQLWLPDSTAQFAGSNFTSYVERTGLPIPFEPGGPPDMRSRKFIRDIFPRIDGTIGGVVKVYFGKQDLVGGPITWLEPKDYIIGTTHHIDVRVNTILAAIRFESTTGISWKLAGYELDVVKAGNW